MNAFKSKEQNKTPRKKGRIIMIIILIILSCITVFILTGTILQKTHFSNKLSQIKPYGKLVDVEDGYMHVFSMGHGNKTIIMLPGMGISLPSADFSPLMRKLSIKYTVVCIEYFGVGFSSETSTPRDCHHYVEEIRTALDRAGFQAPYILMPHSISNVYGEYYASTYPNEIEAFISLDGTSTATYQDMPAAVKKLLPIAKFQQSIGVTSLLSPLAINKIDLVQKGYTKKEIYDMIVFSGFTINTTLINQIINSSEFIKQTMDLPFPATIPYFKIISKQTFETDNQQFRSMNITPKEYQEKHLERIGHEADYEILEGNHFIYQNNIDRIAEITDSLLNKVQ